MNAAVKPVSDQDNYGKRDYWTLPRNGKGDCEDYVLLKRAKLMSRGISPSQLLITMVQGSEPHIVLTVRTDHGDYILDNMRGKCCRWSRRPIVTSRCNRRAILASGFR